MSKTTAQRIGPNLYRVICPAGHAAIWHGRAGAVVNRWELIEGSACAGYVTEADRCRAIREAQDRAMDEARAVASLAGLR
jgi:hypothetical protein